MKVSTYLDRKGYHPLSKIMNMIMRQAILGCYPLDIKEEDKEEDKEE